MEHLFVPADRMSSALSRFRLRGSSWRSFGLWISGGAIAPWKMESVPAHEILERSRRYRIGKVTV